MITPGTAADWTMATTLLGTVLAFGALGYRWILADEPEAAGDAPPAFRAFERIHTPERERSAS